VPSGQAFHFNLFSYLKKDFRYNPSRNANNFTNMFAERSKKLEILDQDDIPFEDIRVNMQELDFINRWLGGHHTSIAGLKKLLADQQTEKLVIAEIGCGGGDNLRVLNKWCQQNKINASFIGIDMKQSCIAFAKENFSNKNVEWIVSDYTQVKFIQQPDIIFSSLFCHHFTSEQLVQQMQWMQQNAKLGFFINDLQRHPLAYYSIKILTRLFSKSYLVKNDAPLSVLRGFHKNELVTILQAANITSFSIEWRNTFRWLVVVSIPM
jgi:2-polyprenyl-3-methyl-5-hydroxy-6-metoxy-1,4-benzoquinol methylase